MGTQPTTGIIAVSDVPAEYGDAITIAAISYVPLAVGSAASCIDTRSGFTANDAYRLICIGTAGACTTRTVSA